MKRNKSLLYLLSFVMLASGCSPDKKESRIIGHTWAARSQTVVAWTSNPIYQSHSHWSATHNDFQLRLNDNGSFSFKYITGMISNATIYSPLPPAPVTPERKEETSTYRYAGDSVYIVRASDTSLLRLLYGERFPTDKWPHGDSIFLHQVNRDSMVSKFQWGKRIYDQFRNDSITISYTAITGFRKI